MAYLYQRRVAFADTDAAGRVHFSRLLCYVEEAEHALLRELNIPLMEDGGWPRVQISCDYFKGLKPEDEVEVVLIPDEVGRSSIHWSFNIFLHGEDVAKGTMKTVRVDANGNPSSILPEWRDALEGVLKGEV